MYTAPLYEERQLMTSGRLVATVRNAVAAVECATPNSIEPVSEVVDKEALRTLVETSPQCTTESSVCVSFELSRCAVFVYQDGRIVAFPVELVPDRPAGIGLANCPTDFERTLSNVVQTAHQTGIDVCGSWSLRNGSAGPDLEVAISEITNPAHEKDGERTVRTDRF